MQAAIPEMVVCDECGGYPLFDCIVCDGKKEWVECRRHEGNCNCDGVIVLCNSCDDKGIMSCDMCNGAGKVYPEGTTRS